MTLAAEHEAISVQILPVLIQVVKNIESQLAESVISKKISDIRAIQIQENANEVFTKIYGNIVSTDAVALKFLDDFSGYNFLIERIVDKGPDKSDSKQETVLEMNQQVSEGIGKNSDSDFESNDSDETQYDRNVMDYVGNKLGLRLTKTVSERKSLIMKKRDTELLNAAKIKPVLRKSTAMVKTNSGWEAKSPNAKNKSYFDGPEADQEKGT